MSFEAFLFDLDGTLINSSGLLTDAVKDALLSRSAVIPEEILVAWQARRGSWDELLDENGLPRDAFAPLEAVAMEHFATLLKTQSSWMHGAESLLARLGETDVPFGIVTNAYKQFFDALDERFSLTDIVSIVITSEDMDGKLKPDPFGLLLAAAHLKVDPSRIAYVGDNAVDVAAAIAAGMRPLLVGPANAGHDVHAGAYERFSSLRDLETALVAHQKMPRD